MICVFWSQVRTQAFCLVFHWHPAQFVCVFEKISCSLDNWAQSQAHLKDTLQLEAETQPWLIGGALTSYRQISLLIPFVQVGGPTGAGPTSPLGILLVYNWLWKKNCQPLKLFKKFASEGKTFLQTCSACLENHPDSAVSVCISAFLLFQDPISDTS